MKLEEVQRKNKEKRTIVVALRITQEVSDWMKENEVSPTLVFNKTIEELRKK